MAIFEERTRGIAVIGTNFDPFLLRRLGELLQFLLEVEIDVWLGRQPFGRRQIALGNTDYRNGYGRPTDLPTSIGQVRVRRPRVRGLSQKFRSGLLPLFRKQARRLGTSLPQVLVRGLAKGNLRWLVDDLFGQPVPIPTGALLPLQESWQADRQGWELMIQVEAEGPALGKDEE